MRTWEDPPLRCFTWPGAACAPCELGSARPAGGVLGQDSLLARLDLGELPRSHRFDPQLNGGNDWLANQDEFDAPKNSPAAWEEESPAGMRGIPALVSRRLAAGTEAKARDARMRER